MAEIDVSDILSDPDFVSPMTLIDRSTKVNSRGENILVETPTQSFGVIQPATGRVLQRIPEAMRVANVQSFWFKGKIVASEPGQYSSILVSNGKRFQVQLVFDWQNYGAEWCEGTCVAEVPA